ncbi:tRNA-guanine(15) transglycosylase-like protein [Gongronella butleri]|nr:tRNA-guanine(15) transglycosylase-like protein [Gongronella butleri]
MDFAIVTPFFITSLEEKDPSSLKFTAGLHKYLNLEGQLVFCDVRDPQKNTLKAINTDKYLSIDTHGGTRQITPELWTRILQSYRPDLIATMADTINDKDPGVKRIRRSVDRTLKWLDACLAKAKGDATPIIAHVMGNDNVEERKRSSEETAKRDVQGFVLDVHTLDHAKFDDFIKASLEPLPADKLRIGYGLIAPEQILRGVRHGIDMFDGSYAYRTTQRGRAIMFKYGADSHSDELQEKTLNLWDKQYADAFEPLDATCTCYACSRGQTRAYIHHLLNAHEMLATILLMSHNVFKMNEFMQAIRTSIDEGQFDKRTDAFMRQYKHDKETDGELSHEDEISAQSLGVSIKKKRTAYQ